MMEKENIPVYNLFINPKSLMELKKDIWANKSVTGKINIHNKKHDIDVIYRGFYVRELKKKSYHIHFYKPSTWEGAKELHLNAEYKDHSFIRNKLSFDFFSSIGVMTPSAEHVFLVLNGKKEGVYLQLESVDEYYFQKRGIPVHSIFYAVDGDANFSLMSEYDNAPKKSLGMGYEIKYGKDEECSILEEFIFKTNTLLREEFEQEIGNYIDVEKYLLWLAGAVCTQNYDGFVQNYALCRNGEAGLFEILPWDYDGTWGRDVHGEIMEYDFVRIDGFNTLSARMLDVPSFRNLYYKNLLQILNSQFTVDFMKPRIQELHTTLRPFVLKDPYKKDYIEQFDMEPEFICKSITDRNNYLRSELKKRGFS
ncbi:spore coat protein [Cytobacillus depressus]|uniref:Spore coat protein n=1 Tax=Cytobacillus depressus TaxID=1602942 RepID=A0A6L3VAF8_9BACI|nr:CotH kinase family protein [Cytobacillus depressus]KAB2336078.1 spore coat protein [Cytobacillus depressus]